MDLKLASLTAKQKKVYLAIEKFIKTNNIPPTVREIGEMVGEKTPGSVQGILNRLEQKGVIERQIGMARSIRLVNKNSLYSEPSYIPKIKKVTQRNVKDIYSVYNTEKYLPLPPELVETSSKMFIIECQNQGLVSKGINPGDLLIIDQESDLNDGDIVMFIYNNYTSFRQYHFTADKDIITLTSDINLFNKETFKKDEISIVGKVAGLFRDLK